jgi:hypothetical protein
MLVGSKRDGTERTLQRRLQVQRGIGNGGGAGKIDPGCPRYAYRRRRHRIALVGELQRGGAIAGDENVGGCGGVERGEPRVVSGFNREEGGAVDLDRPAAPQRIDGAGDVAPFTQISNSVMSGT